MREIPFGRPLIGDDEKNAVLEVLGGHILTHGPRVKEFEMQFKSYTDSKNAIAVASCTAGLHLIYFHVGIKEGDEVIVPAQTHVATAHAVELCGGTPVFVDSEMTTGNIDIDQIESKITKNTKAISVVHYLGMPVDMDRVNQLAKKYNLLVIEDCALALGSKYKGIHAGNLGDVGCFSFYPVKHITTAEGGMIITKHQSMADSFLKKRAFGIDRNIVEERPIPGVYDVQELGYNYRLNELGGALGIEQLKKADTFLNIRRKNYDALHDGIKNIEGISTFCHEVSGYESSRYCYTFILNDLLAEKRVDVIKKLNDNGVGTSIYYPKAVPQMSYYKNKYGYKTNDFPNAERISNHGIALPVGAHLNIDDMHYIVDMVRMAVKEVL